MSLNKIDKPRIENAIREILIAIGEDPNREGLIDTPKRVAKYYSEVCSGINKDPSNHLDKVFSIDHDEIILVRDIPFFSICEHHLVPFFGKAHVSYIPNENGKITGLSKLARLVDEYGKRPQVQERLTGQIATSIDNKLNPKGVAVVIEAEHLCIAMRGIQKIGTNTVTSSMRGVFKDNLASREEVLKLIMGS